MAVATWVLGLEALGVTERGVHFGMARLIELEWPPTLKQFAALCRPSLRELGVPGEAEAYREACRNAFNASYEPVHWSHGAVFHAALGVGLHELRSRPAEESRRAFAKAYAEQCERVASGAVLSVPRVPLLPERVSVPVAKEQARGRLEALRRELRG